MTKNNFYTIWYKPDIVSSRNICIPDGPKDGQTYLLQRKLFKNKSFRSAYSFTTAVESVQM